MFGNRRWGSRPSRPGSTINNIRTRDGGRWGLGAGEAGAAGWSMKMCGCTDATTPRSGRQSALQERHCTRVVRPISAATRPPPELPSSRDGYRREIRAPRDSNPFVRASGLSRHSRRSAAHSFEHPLRLADGCPDQTDRRPSANERACADQVSCHPRIPLGDSIAHNVQALRPGRAAPQAQPADQARHVRRPTCPE